MKKLIVSIVVLVFMCAGVSLASPSLYFSTEKGYTAWTVYKGGTGDYEMSFDNIIVDSSDPWSPNLIGDSLVLPTMLISNLTYTNGTLKMITATLTPIGDGKLYIYDDDTGYEVMRADLGSGAMLSISTAYMAYMNPQNDLSNIATDHPGYSAVIDGFITAEGQNMNIDLSFSGNSTQLLYDLLKNQGNYSVSGTLSGQISAIPAPGAIALASIGIGIVGWLRLRKKV